MNVDTSEAGDLRLAASVVKGRTATLKYKVTETGANAGKATVIIKIKNRAGKVVATLKAGQVTVNVRCHGEVHLQAGQGRLHVHRVRDRRGRQTQAKAGSAKLTVR